MSQPNIKKLEGEATEAPQEEEEVVEEVTKPEAKASGGATVTKPHVAQSTKRAALTHIGVVSGKRYTFHSSRGAKKKKWVAIDPRDADKYKFMAKKNADWYFEERNVPVTREAHYVTYNSTEGSSVNEIEFPMFDHDKKDPAKRKRVYHFIKGEQIEIAAEDAERFIQKASGTKAWTYTKKTVPVGGS